MTVSPSPGVQIAQVIHMLKNNQLLTTLLGTEGSSAGLNIVWKTFNGAFLGDAFWQRREDRCKIVTHGAEFSISSSGLRYCRTKTYWDKII